VHGDFRRGDVIAVRGVAGKELARGLANYSSTETRLIARKPSTQIEAAAVHSFFMGRSPVRGLNQKKVCYEPLLRSATMIGHNGSATFIN